MAKRFHRDCFARPVRAILSPINQLDSRGESQETFARPLRINRCRGLLMPDNVRQERQLVFPIVLIVIGALFLYANYRPNFAACFVLSPSCPLIFFFRGLANFFDPPRAAGAGGGANGGSWSAG